MLTLHDSCLSRGRHACIMNKNKSKTGPEPTLLATLGCPETPKRAELTPGPRAHQCKVENDPVPGIAIAGATPPQLMRPAMGNPARGAKYVLSRQSCVL